MTIRQRLLWGALACLLLFALIAAAVVTGRADATDHTVLAALRLPDRPGAASVPGWVVAGALGVTWLGVWPVRIVLALAAAAVLVARSQRREAVVLAIVWIGGALLLPVMKQIAGRARPDLAWRLTEATHNSFPSGHAMGAAVLYPMAGFLVGRIAHGRHGGRVGLIVGLVLALAIGLSRVLLGVHWLSDVLAGWTVGAAWTLACLGFSRRPAV